MKTTWSVGKLKKVLRNPVPALNTSCVALTSEQSFV